MSRVHEELRRAEQAGELSTGTAQASRPPSGPSSRIDNLPSESPMQAILGQIQEIPFTPSPESHLLDVSRPHEAPTEEFRTLRTRLNHLQQLSPIHNIVVTTPSPAEGKSFAAVNLALAAEQLSGNPTLPLAFHFPRPLL